MATTYEYKAMKDQEFVSGKVRAESKVLAQSQLAAKGLEILELSEVQDGSESWLMNILQGDIGGGKIRLKTSEMILFTEQMASMLKAGLPMTESLEAFIDEKGKKKGSSRVAAALLNSVRSGTKFSAALAEFDWIFPASYLAVVKAGEGSGTLSDSLEYLSDQLKREHELTGKVKSALTYPVIVLVAMVLVMSFIMVAVVPKIVEFAENSGAQLPGYTLAMLKVSNLVSGHWPLVLAMIVITGGGLVLFLSNEVGKRTTSKVVLKVPVFGLLAARYNQVRFARMMGGFYKYGVSVIGSFDILAESLDNYEYKEACARIKSRLEVGQTLAVALQQESDLFPSIMGRLIKGAEKSGELGPTLEKLAVFYEGELEDAMKSVTQLIEPTLVVFLGVGVLGLAMSVVVPIYQVTSGLK